MAKKKAPNRSQARGNLNRKPPKSQPIWSSFQRPGTFNRPQQITPYSQARVSIGNGQFVPASVYKPGMTAATAPPGSVTGRAPAAPAAPALPPAGPVPPSALPVDPIFDAQMGQLERARTQGYADVTGERQRGLSDYGYKESATGALSIDPNNPFSKAALLKRNYDTQRRTVGQQIGSSGGLYSGAFQTAQDVTNRNQLQSQDALTKSLQSFLLQNTRERAKVGTDYETGAIGARSDRIGRAPDNPLYEPTPVPDIAPNQTLTPGAQPQPKVITNKLGHKGYWKPKAGGGRYFVRT